MRILIVGNDPREIGGVSNYTRPLSAHFAASKHDVFFFFSGAWHRKYNWLFRPYLRIDRRSFPYETAELVNSPNWALHNGDPLLDIRNQKTEKIFQKYLEERKPDVLHLHSRLALPISIVETASKMGVPVVNTIHVYGLICPRRVMIDGDGRPCLGPSNPGKCADCIELADVKKLKFLSRIENTAPGLLDVLVRTKGRWLKTRGPAHKARRNLRISDRGKEELQEGLKKRLDYAVHLMNHHVDMNICVSSDVKRTMMRFGVMENNLLVQPIGSVLAARQERSMHALHAPLVLGNIGGVGHYKGTHVLVEAVSRIRKDHFMLKIFGKYDSGYVRAVMKGKEGLPIEFMGTYKPEDLPGILEQIDLMILPSICNDTAPQTIFESYSAKIPIVASNIGGFPDFIEDGINGCLFGPGNSQTLADTLEDILDHPERIQAFSRHIPSLKTIQENARELLSLYRTSRERRGH